MRNLRIGADRVARSSAKRFQCCAAASVAPLPQRSCGALRPPLGQGEVIRATAQTGGASYAKVSLQGEGKKRSGILPLRLRSGLRLVEADSSGRALNDTRIESRRGSFSISCERTRVATGLVGSSVSRGSWLGTEMAATVPGSWSDRNRGRSSSSLLCCS